MLLLLKDKTTSSNEQTVSTLVKAVAVEYPVKIENIFPYWANIKKDATQPNLIDLIKEYYNWLYSDTTNPRSGAAVNSNFGFFELHKIKDWNNYTTDFNFESVLNLYLPDLDRSLIGTEITKEEVKEILNGIKIKLYDKKGTEQSFKYLISLVFGIDQSNVWITYPKKYLMILNGGAAKDIPGVDIGRKGILNFSVLSDLTYWNDFSYIINVSGPGSIISEDKYERVLKPLVHPTGMNGQFQERPDIFNRQNENFDLRTYVQPIIGNYLDFDFNSTASTTINRCGYDGFIQYLFPNWDKNISDDPALTFGDINIIDFLYLEPEDPEADNPFPDESLPPC